MTTSIERDLALIQETYTAIGLAKLGLGSLQSIGKGNDFYHLPLQLLAGSYERLLKVMLAIDHKQRQGEYPNYEDFRKHGHNITKLLSKVTEEMFFGASWITATAGAEDLKFLRSDSLHQELVSVLTHFGKFGRYSDLDVVSGKETVSSPESDWKRIEMKILATSDLDSLSTPRGLPEVRDKINEIIVSKFEIAFRALCRWFTLGGGAPLGQQMSGILTPFLNLSSSSIGKTKWG